jgi:hypothetical protein
VPVAVLNYTVCAPEERQRTFNVTVYRTVPEEKTVTEMDSVPCSSKRKCRFASATWSLKRSAFLAILMLLAEVAKAATESPCSPQPPEWLR